MQNRPGYLFSICLVLAASGVAAKTSFIPKRDTAAFVVRELDLSMFRNSLGPRRNPGQHTFADLGLRPTTLTKNRAVFDNPNWTYTISVLRRRDENGDGIEDIVICFTDNAKHGTYRGQQPLLLTRYGKGQRLMALAFEPFAPDCGRIPPQRE